MNRLNFSLKENGFESIKEEIFEASLAGGTGGEILCMIDKKLLEIKETKPEVYNLIKNEADQIHKHKVKYLGN